MTTAQKAALAAAGIGFTAALVFLPDDALADRTVVYSSAQARITHGRLVNQFDGGVLATVCGITKIQDAGFTEDTCHDCGTIGFPISASDLLSCFKNGEKL